MWTDSTTVLQWIKPNEKQPVFAENSVCEKLEYACVDQWSQIATMDSPVDAVTRGLSAKIFQLSSWVKIPRTEQRRHPSSHYRRHCISGYIRQETDNYRSFNVSG